MQLSLGVCRSFGCPPSENLLTARYAMNIAAGIRKGAGELTTRIVLLFDWGGEEN
jgi:hypothetical protein